MSNDRSKVTTIGTARQPNRAFSLQFHSDKIITVISTETYNIHVTLTQNAIILEIKIISCCFLMLSNVIDLASYTCSETFC